MFMPLNKDHACKDKDNKITSQVRTTYLRKYVYTSSSYLFY